MSDHLRHRAYYLLLELSDELRHLAYERKITQEKYVGNALVRSTTETTTVSIKDLNWTNVSHECLKDVSKSTQLFAIQHLIPAVKHYNMLWHWPTPTKRNEKTAIKELVENKVIFRTEVIGIYLINPVKLWRGHPVVCVEATKDLIRTKGKPTLDMIHDLRPGDKYTLKTATDHYNSLNGDDDPTPNLLKEPEQEYQSPGTFDYC